MNPHTLQWEKEKYAEQLQAIFQKNGEDFPAFRSAVQDLLERVVEECSRTIEDARRESAALQERTEEALERVRTYAEELATVNEELHQANAVLIDQNDELVATRRSAERERQRYYDLFNAAPEGYLVTDGDATILEANHAAASLLAVHKDSLKDRNLVHFVADGSKTEFKTRTALAVDSEPQKDFELHLRPFGKEPVCVSASVVAVHPGEAENISLRWTIRDITRRRQTEKERTTLTGRLEAAHREANLYLDIMTHDLGNANNVSTIYADLMVDQAEGELEAYAKKLRDSIWRSTEIIRNVATIRRVHEESVCLGPVDLDAVIREELGSFPAASIRYEDPAVDVLADNLLPMIFTNLIGNAVKFGGALAGIAIRVEERGREVLVSVEDTGPGIPDEVKGVLFHRFERGMARGKGQGLGLYIVRTLIERYGGRIWIEDRVPGHPEEGVAFRFVLRKVTGDREDAG